MAKKYTKLATQAQLALEKGAGSRVSPGDNVSAETQRLRDSIHFTEFAVGDVIHVGIPLGSGIRPNLNTSKLVIFGDAGLTVTGKFGYLPVSGRLGNDAAYGTAVVAQRNQGNYDYNNGGYIPVESFPPVGDVERLPETCWLIFTVTGKAGSAASSNSAIPATAERGRLYFDIEYSSFN